MEIKIDLIDCKKCGVYLNSEKIEKNILTLRHKEEQVYIYGFICPVCKAYHFRLPHNSYIINRIAEEDEEFEKDKYYGMDIEKYICFKLGIEYKYGENLNEYGEED